MALNILDVAAQRQTLGAAARRHVLESGYGWDSTFHQLFAIYRAATGTQHP